MHEKKISSPAVRIAISYGCPINQFLWVSIREWANQKRETGQTTVAEYCAVNELEGSDCLNFMAYTLVKGLGDIESRLG